jgi:hypothetical protein
MKKLLVYAAMALLIAVAFYGPGCSPTQTAWVERGLQGIEYAKSNQTTWYQAAVEELNKDRQRSISVTFAETRSAMTVGVRTSATQPTTRPVDADWLIVQEKALLATMGLYDQRKEDLDMKYQQAMRNLDATGEAFTQIQRLNRAWAGDRDELAAQIAKIAATVESLRAERSK